MSKEIQHNERAHSVLSASSSDRWMNCTASARMCEGIPSKTSVHAEFGTLAHELSENEIRYRLGIITEKQRNLNRTGLVANKLYDTNMEFPVEAYVSFVMEQVSEAFSLCDDPLLLVEEKVSVEEYVPEGFGTCDFMAIAEGVLFITDLKFGTGVRVSAIENSQLKIYALGALEAYGMLYDVHTVRITIVQPRLDAISQWEVPVEDLYDWAENEVKPKAKEAFEGKGDPVPGDWCKFCNAKALCPALKLEALFLAEEDFSKPETVLEEQELLEVYHIADRVKSYLDAVQQHIYDSALKGKKWEGLKVVQGKGRDSITDPDTAMKLLKKEGVHESLYVRTQTTIETLGNLKKNLGKAKLQTLLGHLIKKSEGKPALVADTDSRPEIDRASDFE